MMHDERPDMREWSVGFAAAAGGAFLLLTAQSTHAQPFVYVTNAVSRNVTVVDAGSQTVTQRIALGLGTPSDIALSPDGARAYVVSVNPASFIAIDTRTNAIAAVIPLSTSRFDDRVAVAPDGSTAYVTNSNEQQLAIVDTAAGAVSGSVSLGCAPSGIALAPNGRYAYLTCPGSSAGSAAGIVVVDTATKAVTAIIPIPSAADARGISISPDGNSAYVAGGSTGEVVIVDTVLARVVAMIRIGQIGGAIVVAPDGRSLYVTDLLAETVVVIDVARRTVAADIQLDGYVGRLGLTPDGGSLYVTQRQDCSLTVIDTATRRVTDRVMVDEYPNALAVGIPSRAPATPVPTPSPTAGPSPGAEHLCAYVPIPMRDVVSVVDLERNAVTGEIPIPHPLRVTVGESDRVYVTGYLDEPRVGAVFAIDTRRNVLSDTIIASGLPYDLALTPDGTRLYASLLGSECFAAVVIDPSTNGVVGQVAAEPGAPFSNLAIGPGGTTAYITRPAAKSVVVVDLATNMPVASLLFNDAPQDVAFTPDGAFAYVTTAGEDADRPSPAVVIETATLRVVKTIPLENGPVGIAISPDGSQAYVTNAQSGTVSVIRTASNDVLASVHVPGFPLAVAFVPSGALAYVTTLVVGSEQVEAGFLVSIDTATMTVAGTVALNGVGDDVAIASVAGDCSAPPTVTPTPSVTDTSAPTMTPTPSPTPTVRRTVTATSTATRATPPTPTATLAATISPTRSGSPTAAPVAADSGCSLGTQPSPGADALMLLAVAAGRWGRWGRRRQPRHEWPD